MTIAEYEHFFNSHHIRPASLLFQGDSKERIKSLETYLNGGELPVYNYDVLEEYCSDSGRIISDSKHLHSCVELIKEVVPTNETELKIIDIYKEKTQYRIQERSLIASAYKELVAPSDISSAVFEHSKKLYGDLDILIYHNYLQNIDVLHEFDGVLDAYHPAIYEQFKSYFVIGDKYNNLDIIDVEKIVKIANELLQTNGYSGWRAVKTNKATGVCVIKSFKELRIPVIEQRSIHDSVKLLIHEIGVHIARRENGSKCKYAIFSDGTQSDNRIEEGVSIFIEAVVDAKLPTLPSALYRAAYRYLALVYALQLDGVKRHTVKQVYDDLKRHNEQYGDHVSEEQLMLIIDNIYRGTNFSNPRNVFLRAKVYMEGFISVAQYADKQIPSVMLLDKFLQARYDFTQTDEVRILE